MARVDYLQAGMLPVFGFKSFGAPGTDVLWRAYGGAKSDEATLLWGPVAMPDLVPQF